jgi:hypothetical protein
MAQVCNSSDSRDRNQEDCGRGHPVQKITDNNFSPMVGSNDTHLSSQATQESTNRQIMVQASLGINGDPISKLTKKVKKTWGLA